MARTRNLLFALSVFAALALAPSFARAACAPDLVDFGPGQSTDVGYNPSGCVARDFDGDGILDLVVAANEIDPYYLSGFSFLHGNGNGTFASPIHHAFSGSLFGLATADLDDDGKLDLAIASVSGSAVATFRGDGAGGFTTWRTLAMGPAPHHVTIGDLDHDGIADIVVANNTVPAVTVRLGTGGGSFGVNTSYAIDNLGTDVAIADVNEDGHPDLIAPEYTSATVGVLLGRGDGTFQPRYGVYVGGIPYCATLADVNGDGHLDLFVGSQGAYGCYALLGHGDGTFAASFSLGVGAVPQVIVEDFDGDAVRDVAFSQSTANSVTLVRGAGDGSFVPRQTMPAGPYPLLMASGDFNRDGLLDVAAMNFHVYTATILLGQCDAATPVDASLATWRATPTGVELEWLVDAHGVKSATLERGDGAGTWTVVASGTPDPNGRLVLADDDVAPGTTVLYRLAFTTGEGTFHSAPSTILVPALALALEGARPNPAASATLALAFTLRTDASASLELYDVAGRRVLAREVGAFGPGRHVLDLRDAHLAGGVYLARLTQGGEQRQARIVVL